MSTKTTKKNKSDCKETDQKCDIDQKRNDEQQYNGDGVAHDPHADLKERVDRNDPNAGDLDEETRSEDAPFNKTYGDHK